MRLSAKFTAHRITKVSQHSEIRNPHSAIPCLFAILTIFFINMNLIYSRYEIDCKNSKIIYLKKNYNKKTLKRYVFF
jgi:hypothetical protein